MCCMELLDCSTWNPTGNFQKVVRQALSKRGYKIYSYICELRPLKGCYSTGRDTVSILLVAGALL